jgi:hypothetical protein
MDEYSHEETGDNSLHFENMYYEAEGILNFYDFYNHSLDIETSNPLSSLSKFREIVVRQKAECKQTAWYVRISHINDHLQVIQIAGAHYSTIMQIGSR